MVLNKKRARAAAAALPPTAHPPLAAASKAARVGGGTASASSSAAEEGADAARPPLTTLATTLATAAATAAATASATAAATAATTAAATAATTAATAAAATGPNASLSTTGGHTPQRRADGKGVDGAISTAGPTAADVHDSAALQNILRSLGAAAGCQAERAATGGGCGMALRGGEPLPGAPILRQIEELLGRWVRQVAAKVFGFLSDE